MNGGFAEPIKATIDLSGLPWEDLPRARGGDIFQIPAQYCGCCGAERRYDFRIQLNAKTYQILHFYGQLARRP